MIIARIHHADRDDCFAQLEQGRRTFGSDLDCDIVLLDHAVAPRHFEIDISDTGVTLHVCEGETVTFSSKGEGEVEIGSEAAQEWTFCDHLNVGAFEVHLRGEECKAPSPRLTALAALAARVAQHSGIIARGFVMMVGIVVTIGLATIIVSGEAAISADARMPHQDVPVDRDAVPIATASIDRKAIEDRLESMGLTPYRLRRNGTTWHATFYFASMSDRDAAAAAITAGALPMRPRMVLDSALLAAANIVLRGVETKVEIDRVENGVLYLTAEFGATAVEAVRDQLRTDVPGLRNIVLNSEAEPDVSDVIERISGVWGGDRPVVFLRDGGEVRPGDPIDDTTRLVSVLGQARLLLEFNGTPREVEIP